MTWESEISNRPGKDPAFAKQGDIIVSQDDEFPEFYVQVRVMKDILIVGICDHAGTLLVECAVKQKYLRA